MANRMQPQNYKSRILAALDLPSEREDENIPSSSKHKLTPEHTPQGSISKKRKMNNVSEARLAAAPLFPQLSNMPATGLPLPFQSPFGINFNVEAPVSKIDIGGADQAERMADFVTKSIENASQGVTVKDAVEYLGLQDKKDFMPGMEVRLLPHQLIGVAWMLQQERESKYKGGILADEMGLGKTVQTIAIMAANMPPPRSFRRTTLIVVPAALLLQWKEEIESKTNGIFDVHIHHGKDKLRTIGDLSSQDIIITTYQTLNNDFAVPKDIDPADEDEWLEENGGLLSQMEWYRVVLDEAQFIRNRSTRSSKSVARLDSKYRWTLTGTPVTNSLADIYGLLRFGRFRPFNDWDDFNTHIVKVQNEDAPLAGLRAQEILKPLLLRRTKDAELEGEPLLVLPTKNVMLETLEFSADERELYNSFENRAKIRMNRFFKERSVMKNHAVVLVMILRLRQLCCHPYLILSLSDGAEDPTLVISGKNEQEFARAMKAMGYNWVNQVKKRFIARARVSEFDFADETDGFDISCPACNDILLSDNGRILQCGHEMCNDCVLELRGSPIAHDGIFGYGDERETARIEKEYENAVAKGWRPCPTCKKMIDLSQEKIFKSSAFQPSQEEVADAIRAQEKEKSRPAPVKASSHRIPNMLDDISELSDSSEDDLPDVGSLLQRKEKGKAKARPVKRRPLRIDESDEDVVAISSDTLDEPRPTKGKAKLSNTNNNGGPAVQLVAAWNKKDADMEPSTKMMALIRLLRSWEHTGDKCICYSQWTTMLDLVETLFSRYGIQNLRYDGKMSKDQREMALSKFKKAGGPKVMLISTKCGSVGLNLVSANRCVNLDLSWNYSSENQAFDRMHRLGQEKEVFVHRLVVRNTIEERMLALQDTKVGLAEAALGEGSGIKLHKLSVKELKALFGMNQNHTHNRDLNQ